MVECTTKVSARSVSRLAPQVTFTPCTGDQQLCSLPVERGCTTTRHILKLVQGLQRCGIGLWLGDVQPKGCELLLVEAQQMLSVRGHE